MKRYLFTILGLTLTGCPSSYAPNLTELNGECAQTIAITTNSTRWGGILPTGESVELSAGKDDWGKDDQLVLVIETDITDGSLDDPECNANGTCIWQLSPDATGLCVDKDSTAEFDLRARALDGTVKVTFPTEIDLAEEPIDLVELTVTGKGPYAAEGIELELIFDLATHGQ